MLRMNMLRSVLASCTMQLVVQAGLRCHQAAHRQAAAVGICMTVAPAV